MAAGLGHGASVGAALAAARRAAFQAGAPTAAWAGLVVLGDGDFVPVPGGRALGPEVRRFVAIAVLFALALTVMLLVRRRSRRRSRAR
jgi:type VI protein secretion system component VasK